MHAPQRRVRPALFVPTHPVSPGLTRLPIATAQQHRRKDRESFELRNTELWTILTLFTDARRPRGRRLSYSHADSGGDDRRRAGRARRHRHRPDGHRQDRRVHHSHRRAPARRGRQRTSRQRLDPRTDARARRANAPVGAAPRLRPARRARRRRRRLRSADQRAARQTVDHRRDAGTARRPPRPRHALSERRAHPRPRRSRSHARHGLQAAARSHHAGLAARQPRQTLLFSATLPPDLGALARMHLRDPVRVDVGRQAHAAASCHPGRLPRRTARTRRRCCCR